MVDSDAAAKLETLATGLVDFLDADDEEQATFEAEMNRRRRPGPSRFDWLCEAGLRDCVCIRTEDCYRFRQQFATALAIRRRAGDPELEIRENPGVPPGQALYWDHAGHLFVLSLTTPHRPDGVEGE